jgi:geranylgeranyl pyrophosphate synthase
VPIIDPRTAPADVRSWLAEAKERIDADLSRRLEGPVLGEEDPISVLADAMRYAVLGGGKRLRPALVLAAARACGGSEDDALPAAAAVEMLHAYTLVHDDLPAMDDDDERRGRPTVHIQYDEATAILVGDALLTSAFATIATLARGAGEAVAVLAGRAGRDELLGGQMLDLLWQQEGRNPSFDELERLHRGKTGALFAASCELGAIAAGASDSARRALADYGMSIGVAFQHADDLDDGDFPELAARARERRIELAHEAISALASFDDGASTLRHFAQWIGRAE